MGRIGAREIEFRERSKEMADQFGPTFLSKYVDQCEEIAACFSRHSHGATLHRIFFGFEAQSLTNSVKS